MNAPETLRASFPNVVSVAERFGINVDESLEEWALDFDVAGINTLVSHESSAFEVAKWIREVVARHERLFPLLAYLVAEERLRSDAAMAASYLRTAGTSLESVYVDLVERLGEAFLSAAFDATWKRRAVFSRALDAARTYLEYVGQHHFRSTGRVRRGIQTRIGISTVLTARFGPVLEGDLREAQRMLLEAHEQGSEYALTYYIEASTWLYDLYQDEESVREAARRILQIDNWDNARTVAAAHIWLRLAGSAASNNGRQGFIQRGKDLLDLMAPELRSGRKEEAAAAELLSSMFRSLEHQVREGYLDLSTRGILFPFGLRRPDSVMPAALVRALPELIQVLDDSELHGDFVYRDIRAELLSRFAREPTVATDDAESALRKAIKLRVGELPYPKRLKRAGVEIELAEDRFLLARLVGSTELRRAGVRELLNVDSDDTPSPRHLTVLAREIARNGPLVGAFLDGPDDLVFAIRTGDSTALFDAAARSAYKSADLTRVKLGGRSGVVTLRDSDGAAGQTFVFKKMTPETRDRDKKFTDQVSGHLSDRGLEGRFGVIEHLTEFELTDGKDDDFTEIVSVRRYTSGTILRDFLRLQPPDKIEATLADTSEFLALIHWAGSDERDTFGIRRELWTKELGRWTRQIFPDDTERASFFEAWWKMACTAPLIPRRDAHPLNWLVGLDGSLLAVDLESIGVRPFGYELAQLVEDGLVVDPVDDRTREVIVHRYTNTWSELSGEVVAIENAMTFYELGALARATRAMTQPGASSEMRSYGGRLVDSIVRKTANDDVREVATILSRRWSELTGNIGDHDYQVLSNAERRRISRAMSYHLRHDAHAPATKDGWVHVDELADLLRASGHKVASPQLILIAGALGEPRFELDGNEIRAVYGHSKPTNVEYSVKRAPRVLYHATPLRNLSSIFEARAGLVKGHRNWVHLTDSCEVAVNAAQRQQSSVAVLEIDANSVEGLVHASGTTWLAPSVAVNHLSFLPLREVHDLMKDDSNGSSESV